MDAFVKGRKNIPQRKVAKRNASGERRTRPNFDTEVQTQYSFLTEVFNPVLSINLPVCDAPFGQVFDKGTIYWVHGKDVKIDARKNIEFIRQSVQAYYKIQHKEFLFEPSDNPLSDLSNLLKLAMDVAPENMELGLDYDENRNLVVIHEYALCDFDYNTLFFLPVSFVNKLPEDLRPLVKSLLAMIKAFYHLQEPTDHMDMSFALGMWDEGEQLAILKVEDPEQWEITNEITQSYLEGDISQLISECSQFPQDMAQTMVELEEARRKYEDTEFGPMLNSFKDGIILHGEGSWSNFEWSPDHCWIEDYDNHEEGCMDHIRLFALVYDLMDEIVEQATNCINGDAGNIELNPLYDYRILTPEIDIPFVPSDFPKRWCAWFEGLVNNVMKI